MSANALVKHVLERCKVVLLDMNSTFMFGEDRFGPAYDYAATYRGLGGERLNPRVLITIVDACYASMAAMYEDPAYENAFPQVREVLENIADAQGLTSRDIDLIEEVIACHELGHIPPAYAEMLHRLSRKYELGIIGNLWSKKNKWLDSLEQAGVLSLFKGRIVISSDSSSMKPSSRLFEEAISLFDVDVAEMVYIGDSARCDIEGARRVGMPCIWIQGEQSDVSGIEVRVKDLLNLGRLL